LKLGLGDEAGNTIIENNKLCIKMSGKGFVPVS
jgi:hypothetical protein